VQHQRVSVRIAEEGLVAYPGVDGLAIEFNALRLELSASGGNVRDAERQAGGTWRERLPDAGRVEDVERHLAGAELNVVLTVGLDLESQRLP
jgi:hypothetical protein